MRLLVFLVLLGTSAFSPAQEIASLIITDSESSISRFVRKVELLGDHKHSYNPIQMGDTRIAFENVQVGNYHLKYTTIFGDSLIHPINLAKSKKYKVKFPENKLYDKVDFISQIENIGQHRIQVYIGTQSGCLVNWSDQIFIYRKGEKNWAYFYSTMYDQPHKLDYPNNAHIEVNNEFENRFVNFVKAAMLSKEECQAGYSGGTQSYTTIKYQNQIMEFDFCPIKLAEWTELMKLFKTLDKN